MQEVTLNGDDIQTVAQTIAELIGLYGLDKGRYAVEVDGELVPKDLLSQTPLKKGQKIEIVAAVGGG